MPSKASWISLRNKFAETSFYCSENQSNFYENNFEIIKMIQNHSLNERNVNFVANF